MGSVGKTSGTWGMWRPFWSKSSNCSLSYTSAHDNLTLWDKLTEKFGKQYDSTDDKLLRMNKMAGATVLVSKGGAFMQAGEEFARTKHGDDNSYKSADSVNKIDWNRLNTHENIWKYYEGMLSIRQAFSGFTQITTRSGDNWHPNNNNLEWIAQDVYGVSAFTETNNVKGEWDRVAVIINNKTTDATVDLSKYSSKWVVIADGNTAGLTKISECDGSVKAAGKSVVVAVPKDTFDANPDVGNRNTAPTISIAQTSIETTPGQKVEFEVKASDKDGDTVILTASGLPEGATFENGTFTWESAKKGEYTVTFTASDGKDKTTKTVTIKVTSASEALEKLIAEVEAAGLSKDDYTENVWNALQNALEQAKQVTAKEDASQEEITNAVTTLQNAYDAVLAEKEAREGLQTYVKEAETTIAAANESNDASIISDAKTVLEEAKTLLDGVATKEAYNVAKSNLEDSVNALVVGSGKTSLHVSASAFSKVYAYAWTGTGTSAEKLLGAWPGKQLTEKDSDGNYVIELDDVAADSKFNLIINDGSTSQTKDIEDVSGKVTVTVDATSSGTQNGNKVYNAKATSEPVSATTPEITKKSLQAVIKDAETYKEEDYTEESYAVLKEAIETASKVNDKESATQLEINQTTRALRAAMLNIVKKQGNVVEPTPAATASTEPTAEATSTPQPNQSSAPDSSSAPEQSSTPSPTDVQNTPEATTNPTNPVETVQPGIDDATAAPSVTATVAPTASPVVESDFKISSVKFSPRLCQVVNNNIIFSVDAKGGVGTYKYKYEVYLGSKQVLAKNYGSSRTLKYKPTKAGTYRFKVSAMDEDGVVRTVTKYYVVV